MNYEKIAHFLARIIIGVLFALAAVNNIVEFQELLRILQSKAVPIAAVLLVAMVVVQMLAGVALILGFKLRMAAIALMLLLVFYAAIFVFYWHPGWATSWESKQITQNLGILAALLLLSCSKGKA